MCDGGLDRTQISESVVIITMLTALRFDSQNNWRIDELGDVLERLGDAGEGLVREFWQQVDTRVDLLPVDMLNAAHDVADGRGAQTLRPTRGRSQREDDDYADDGYLDSPRSRYDEDDYGESRRAGSRGRSGYGASHYSREDERERTGDMRARGREYDARAGDARLGFVQRARGQRPWIGQAPRADATIHTTRTIRTAAAADEASATRCLCAIPCRKPTREEALVRGHGDAGRAGDCGHRVGGVLRRQVSEIVRSNPFRNGMFIETPHRQKRFLLLQSPPKRDIILSVDLTRPGGELICQQIKSAIKRVKVTKVKTDNNRSAKTAMRTVVKKFENGVAEGKADVAMLNVTASAIDKAASKGVIHKNAANRKKARLAKRLAKAAQ